MKKKIQHRCEYCEVFKITYFEEHPQRAASTGMILNVSDHSFIPTMILKGFRYLPKIPFMKTKIDLLFLFCNVLRIANRFFCKAEHVLLLCSEMLRFW